MATRNEYEKMRADYEKDILYMGMSSYYVRSDDVGPYSDELQMLTVEFDQILDTLRRLVSLERVRLEFEYGVELRDARQGGGERE
ncbi:hypothetical protein [Pseudoscardovia radai]|uniref:hypothetical protein n=1 Tax=Pseudoscardovia radai TaxID=987066 RepID=UPI003993E78B